MYTLASLAQLHHDLDIPLAETSQDARLIACLEAASRLLEQVAGRRFSPFQRSLAHALPHDPGTLLLDDDLLELTQLRDGGGPIAPDAYTLWPPDPPHSLLMLREGRAFTSDGSPRPIVLEGLWGWHDHWPDAFRPTGDWVRDSPLAFDTALMTVGSASASDAQGDPFFAGGALLRINAGVDAEYVRVIGVDALSSVLTVQRGQQGMASHGHLFGAELYTWQTPRLALEIVRTWAAQRFLHTGHDDAPPANALYEQAAMLRRVRVSAR